MRAQTGGAATTVLVVDDSAAVRTGVTALLSSTGEFEVVGEAHDGQAAVELARSLRPDVVVMDLAMPVLDGLAATRLIVAELPACRVVVLSASQPSREADALGAGAAAFLVKDGRAHDLLATLRRLTAS